MADCLSILAERLEFKKIPIKRLRLATADALTLLLHNQHAMFGPRGGNQVDSENGGRCR